MGSSLKNLSSRQLERLKSELAEVIIANFCYPSFLDYQLNMLRTRPVDRRKRREVWGYVNSVNLNSLGTMDAAAMEFRRFVERVFLRYIEMNRALIEATAPRQVTAMRARVSQLAVQMARGLADYLALGEASLFGRARPVESWATLAQGHSELTWEQIERSTQLLQTTLIYLRTNRDTGPAVAVTGSGPRGADVSDFPTRMLPSPIASYPLTPAERTNGIADGYGAHALLSNGLAGGDGNGNMPVQPLAQEEPGTSRQPFGSIRSRTASRPINGPLSLPSLPLPVASSPPSPTEPQSGPFQKQPQPLEPAPAFSSSAPASALESPLDDLPELPESFEVPPALDLPPDLAELYGDYLRDSRAGVLDLSPADPTGAPQPPEAHASSLELDPEVDEEVNALFDALASHIAEEQEPVSAPARDEQKELSTSQNAAPAELQGSTSSSPLQAAQSQPDPGASAAGKSAASGPLNAGPQGAAPQPDRTSSSGDLKPAGGTARPAEGDVMIFAQLQHQVTTWVKMAAVSHQIEIAGRDAEDLVAELRRMAALEEAELQVIEALVTLCQRVTYSKQATMDDYKQAMMLYLLHHRSRLAL